MDRYEDIVAEELADNFGPWIKRQNVCQVGNVLVRPLKSWSTFVLFEPDQSIQRVQNMYGKGGKGVFNAELRRDEIFPSFKIFLDTIAELQIKDTLPISLREVWN